ncbi:MAG: hypothetical protein WC291_01820 [Thermodesulfovibrionales bacterium]
MDKKTIVHVEVDSIYHKLFQRELKDQFGEMVLYVGFFDPLVALDFIRSNKPDLIISCMYMEGKKIGGFELLRECKSLHPETPFLMHTALGYRDEFAQSGAEPDSYILKSPDPSDLMRSIAEFLCKQTVQEFMKT